MVQTRLKREVSKEIYKHGVVLIAEEDSEIKDERKLHFKKESGKSTSLENKRYES